MENQKTEIKEVDQIEMKAILDREIPKAKALLELPGIEGFAVMVVSNRFGLKASIHAPNDAAYQIVCMMDRYQVSIADVIKKYLEKGGKT